MEVTCSGGQAGSEGVSNAQARRAPAQLPWSGQDYAQLHHRSTIMLLAISQQRDRGAIKHYFGRHLRLHRLEWHFGSISRTEAHVEGIEISRTRASAYPRVRNAVSPSWSA